MILVLLLTGALGITFPLGPSRFTKHAKWQEGDTLILYKNREATEFEDLYTGFSNHTKIAQLKFGVADCAADPEICSTRNISTFPYLEFASNGEFYPFFHQLTRSGLSAFLTHLKRPNIQLDNLEQYTTFTRLFPVSFILFFNGKSHRDSDMQAAFHYDQLASKLKFSHLRFAQTNFMGLWKYSKVEMSDLPVVMAYGLDSAYSFNVSRATVEMVDAFIEKHRFPMLLPLNYSTWNAVNYYVKDQVVFTVFADKSNWTEFNSYAGHLKAIQWGFRKQNDSRFIMTYDETHPTLAKEFKIRETPIVVATDYRDGKVTRYYLHGAIPTRRAEFIELIESIWDKTVPDRYLVPQEPPKYSVTRPEIQLALLAAILLTIVIPCCLCTLLNIFRKEKQD